MTAKEFEGNYLEYLNEIGQVVKPEFDGIIQYLSKIRLNEIIHQEKQFLDENEARGFVWNVFLITNSVFKYVSKEYILFIKNVNSQTVKEASEQICKRNLGVSILIVKAIPEEYIEKYAEFSLEAERNTKGLLKKGEISKINAAYITEVYNKRGTEERICFDVLLIDNLTDTIIGKLNSYGNINGGPCNVYHMYVHEDFRNRSLGRLLLLKTIEYACEMLPKVSSFQLQTHENNLSAQKIISEIGFLENESRNREIVTNTVSRALID